MNRIDNAVSRRRLLGYLGIGAGTLGLAACGGSGGPARELPPAGF
ncbi:twin-arginine translocation signal domain-containing protein [Brachybacterium sp. Z12]|nr:twin-arginine translocation signal domain-containing protein [Brachybacterium sp. Z12]